MTPTLFSWLRGPICQGSEEAAYSAAFSKMAGDQVANRNPQPGVFSFSTSNHLRWEFLLSWWLTIVCFWLFGIARKYRPTGIMHFSWCRHTFFGECIYIGIGIYVIYIYSTMQQIEAQAKSILRGSEVLHSQMRIHLLTGYDSVQGVKS